jgi:hypothetical protein
MTVPSWKQVVCSVLGEGGVSWWGPAGGRGDRTSNVGDTAKGLVVSKLKCARSECHAVAISGSQRSHIPRIGMIYCQADPYHPFGVQAGLCGENGCLACRLPQRTWHRLSTIISCAHALTSLLSSLVALFDILRIWLEVSVKFMAEAR